MANYKKSLELSKEHLDEGEEIVASIFGAYEAEMMGHKTLRNGVLLATSKRIFFYGKKLFGYETETFPYQKISSIEAKKGLLGHSLKFFTSNNKVSMKMINEGDVEGFLKYVREVVQDN